MVEIDQTLYLNKLKKGKKTQKILSQIERDFCSVPLSSSSRDISPLNLVTIFKEVKTFNLTLAKKKMTKFVRDSFYTGG